MEFVVLSLFDASIPSIADTFPGLKVMTDRILQLLFGKTVLT